MYFLSHDDIVKAAASAVEAVTGLSLSDLASSSRTEERVFARMSFASLCREQYMTIASIARILCRSQSTVSHSLSCYADTLAYCPRFRRKDEAIGRLFRRSIGLLRNEF